ncbi:MAG: sulfatase-like hydrolase/transferase, partial [Planctomycetes bacterium]|nr:sulfatase-like hydrolase/transferase [Planctomycetota bacterium]
EPHAPIAAPNKIVSRYGKLNDPAAIYSGTIENTDRAIARLLEKLREVDAPENTLIVYSSDNGSYRADRVGHLRGTKGSNYEGGIRVPGIFHWPGTITKGLVEDEPGGLVDLLPTVCGLLGIDKPNGVHLDGSDLSPLLTGRAGSFKRHQPLFWNLPASGPAVAIRDGRYSMVASRAYEFPRDKVKMAALKKEIEATLRKNRTYETEIRGSTFAKQMFEGFKDKEAEKLRGQFIRLNMFHESWIPTIKAGGYRRFELYDLATDPSQKTDISKQHPDVFERLKKQLLEINASVVADAPDWHLR